MIAGKNNTGKTSVLEAIAVNAGENSAEFLFRLEWYDRRRAIPEVATIFNNFDVENTIKFTGDTSVTKSDTLPMFSTGDTLLSEISFIYDIEEIPSRFKRELMRDLERLSRGLDPEALEENIEFVQLQRFFNNTELKKYLLSSYHRFPSGLSGLGSASRKQGFIFLSARRRISNQTITSRFSLLEMQDKTDTLIQALQIIEPKLRGIKILNIGEPALYVDLGLKKLMPFSGMGDAIDRLSTIILAISDTPDGVVLIDEIENGLHHSILNQVWQAIYRAAQLFNVQVFATTHSYECINAAHEAFSETETYDLGLYRLDRLDDGEIKAVRYNQRTLSTAIEYNFEVR
ncbi:MAG: ATP-binding protein [Anaerolineae bacterium]|nr:ATP-binding protein [Anaerolineae bacterium]